MQCITDVQPNGISGAPGKHIDKKHEIVSGQEKCPKSEMKALAIREIVNAGKTPAGFCIRAICLRCCSGFDGIAGMMMSQDGDDGAVFLLTVHKSVCSHIFFFFLFFFANLQLQSRRVENDRKRFAHETIEIVFDSIQQTQIAPEFK